MGDFKEQLMHIKEDMAKEVISSAIQRYPKKKFEDLYLCLYNKGIKFNIMTKGDAHTILHDLNYYIK